MITLILTSCFHLRRASVVGLLVAALVGGAVGALTSAGPAHAGSMTVSGVPAVVARTSNNLDVFVRASTGELYAKSWNGSWQPWKNLGGLLKSSPVAVARDGDSVFVAVLGTDSRVYFRLYQSGWWTGWRAIENSPYLRGELSVVDSRAYAPGVIALTGRDLNGNVRVAVMQPANGGSAAWYTIPAKATTDPTVAYVPSAGWVVAYAEDYTVVLRRFSGELVDSITTIEGPIQPRLLTRGVALDLVYQDRVNGRFMHGLNVRTYVAAPNPAGGFWSLFGAGSRSMDGSYTCSQGNTTNTVVQATNVGDVSLVAPDGVRTQAFWGDIYEPVVSRPNLYAPNLDEPEVGAASCVAKSGRVTRPIAVARLSWWVDIFGVGGDGQIYTTAVPANRGGLGYHFAGWYGLPLP